ncbi:hypothetical protein [Botrimarina mediterranea]|uniref:Uncharacterized protein n=1 Tax=Botrimarina mediterranea TaxID=2528022 RepID=A0A518KF22_9BACT|nr:hypothetical protein [Botrimarina mediterranea]QDV76389.1 hypothetical protein Spa11_46190 [Botrimarina mediterranea]QDV80986.1 hypothetical protein K2D_46210 [Planctomycetes bacterium K2D]
MIARSIASLALVSAVATIAPAQAPASPAAAVVAPVVAPVAGALSAEAQVREQPLLERPNRLGHFYGNTIRRRHYGTLMVNAKHSDRPLARYFYIP